MFRGTDERPEVQTLLRNIKNALPELEQLLEKSSSHWVYEDFIYRLYHHSFKVFGLQSTTLRIVSTLQGLLPGRALNKMFMQIVEEGTGKTFEPAHNQNWLPVTRPIVEAFFHSRYMLEMAVRYGKSLDEAPNRLPSGWAAFLYLYDLR